jgi:hypothetical protein
MAAAIWFALFVVSGVAYFGITAYVAVRGARDTRDLLQTAHQPAEPDARPDGE